jgi:peptide deformylase
MTNSIFESLGSLWGARIGDEIDPGEVKGTKLKILKYPHPKLRTENEVVSVFDDELKRMASEMLLIMRAADGIGLAAPQVGINKRLMVFNEFADSGKSDMILVNPRIVSKSEETDIREEGCLSFPQINGDVVRSIWIEVEYTTVAGDIVQKKFEGLAARIFQHEYDHLDKVLFVDRFGEKDKAINSKRLEKYVKKYGPGGLP